MANTSTIPRMLVYTRLDAYKCDIDPQQIISLVSTEQINGEHSLSMQTTQELDRSDRILLQDAQGYWHEYVVLGDEIERLGSVVVHAYYCIWSLQYDLMGTYIDTQVGIVPGHASVPSAARLGLEAALSGTTRWTIGTISTTAQASASFYRRNGWDGIKTVVEKWGGEVDATITVGSSGVTARQVNLLDHVGTSTAVRRFDYAADLAGIKADLPEQPLYCRIVPLSKSEQTENGGYSRRKTISDVNQGIVWLEDSNMVEHAKVKNGAGSGWEYPTLIVENDTYEEPTDLIIWAQAHITDYTQPLATYEASVVQLAQAGMNVHGVALGDAVQVVDKTFCAGGLRLDARVIKQVVNLLDPTDIKLTIGTAKATLSGQFQGLSNQVDTLTENSVSTGDYQASAAYLSNLIAELNTQINATGGYTYITQGQGLRTYDVPVADPTSGLEANSVVEIKGGTIRIANTKTAQNDWEWKTVFTSGHVAANLITAANIVTGFIGSANTGTYIDLDSNTVQLGDVTGSHLVIDEDSMSLYDANATRFFYVYDVANDGNYMSQTFVYDGSTRSFTVDHNIREVEGWPRVFARYTSGSAQTAREIASGGFSVSGNTITISQSVTLPETTYEILIRYITSDVIAQAFTFGSRGTGTAGMMSVSFGQNNVAKEMFAMAFGLGLTVQSELQAVFGKYNKADSANKYALIVGNGTGTATANRSNAMTVDWDGNLMAQVLQPVTPLGVAYGGTGQTKTEGTTTVTDIITASSGITISSASYYCWGKLASIYVAWKHSSTISADGGGWLGNLTIGTVTSGKRPKANARGQGDTRGESCELSSGGVLKRIGRYIGENMAESSSVSLTAQVTYLLA